MATKPKPNPMRKPKTPSTRTPLARGKDNKTTAKALANVNDKSYESRNGANGGKGVQWSEYYGKAAQEHDRGYKITKLSEEMSRNKKSGERMARMQSASKSKRSK